MMEDTEDERFRENATLALAVILALAGILLLCSGCSIGVSGHLGVDAPKPPLAVVDQDAEAWRVWVVERQEEYGAQDVVTKLEDGSADEQLYGYFKRPSLIVVYRYGPDGRKLTLNQLKYVWAHELCHWLDYRVGAPSPVGDHTKAFEARMIGLGLWQPDKPGAGGEPSTIPSFPEGN